MPANVAPAREAPVDPARLAAAQDLLTSMRYRETMMKMLTDQKSRLESAISRNMMMLPMGDATPAQIADLRKRMIDTWWANIHPDQMMAEFAKMYARTFSADDLRTMAAFYRTHAGQSLVNETFELPKESGKIFNPQIQAGIPEMLKMQREFMAAHPAKRPPARGPILPPGLHYQPGMAPGTSPKPPPPAPRAAPSPTPASSAAPSAAPSSP